MAEQTRRPLTYAEVYDLYRRKKDLPVFQGMDMPTFASTINEATGTELYSAGLKPSKVKELSIQFDELLGKTGAPQFTGSMFRELARAVTPQYEEQAARIGESIPRSMLEFSGLIAGGAAATAAAPVAPFLAAAAIPLTAAGMLSAGAKTYTDTDSVVAGLIGAASVPLTAGAGRVGATLAAKGLSRRLSSAGAHAAARAVEATGAALGQSALAELAGQASSAAAGAGFYNPFSGENMFQHIANQIAFAPLTAWHVLRRPEGAPSLGEAMNRAAKAAISHAQQTAETARQKYWADRSKPLKAPDLDINTLELAQVGTPEGRSADALLNAHLQAKKDITKEDLAAMVKAPMVGPGEQRSPLIVGKTVSTHIDPATGEVTTRIVPAEELDLMTWSLENRDKTLFGEPVVSPMLDIQLYPTSLRRLALRRFVGGQVGPEGVEAGLHPVQRVLDPLLVFDLLAGHRGQGKPPEAGAPPSPTPPTAPGTTGGGGPPPPPATPTKPLTKAELNAKAAALIDAGVATESVAGTREVARTANDLAGEPVVTDADISALVAEHIAEGKTPTEATKMVQQAIENAAAEQLTRSQRAVVEAEHAMKVLSELPEPAKTAVFSAIAEVTSATSGTAWSDISSANVYRGALNFLRRNPGVDFADPEVVAKLKNVLRLSERHGEMAWHSAQQKRGMVRGLEESWVPLEEQSGVEAPVHAPPEGLSAAGEAAFNSSENKFLSRFVDIMQDLITGKRPITKDEAIAAGLAGANETYLARLNAVLLDFANSTFGDKGGRSQKGFKFHPSDETRKIFGNVQDKTIAKFVTENLSDIRKLIDARVKSVDQTFTAATTPSSMYEILAYFKDSSRYVHGARQGLPPAAYEFFYNQFLKKGHSPREAQKFADSTMRVAAAWRYVDQTRIAELIDDKDAVHGLAILSGPEETPPQKKFATVAFEALSKIPGVKAVASFFKSTVLGHELFHVVWSTAEVGSARETKLRALQQLYDGLEPDTRKAILQASFSVMFPAKYRTPEVTALLENYIDASLVSGEEFLATYAGLVSMGAGMRSEGSIRSLREHIEFSSKQEADFVNGLYLDMREVTGALIDMAVVAGAKGETAAKFIIEANQTIGELLKSRETIQQAVDNLMYLREHMPDSWDALVNANIAGTVEVTRRKIGSTILGEFSPEGKVAAALMGIGKATPKEQMDILQKHLGIQPNWFERYVMIPAHLRELYPVLRDVTRIVFDFRGEASNALTRVMAPFGRVDKFGRVKFDKDSSIIKVRGNKKLEEAMSEILLTQNEEKRLLGDADFRTMDRFPKLTPGEQATLVELHSQISQSVNLMQDLIMEFQKRAIGDSLGSVLLNIGGMRAKPSMTRGGAIAEAAIAVAEAGADPVKLAAANDALAKLTMDLDEKTKGSLKNSFSNLYPSYQKLKQTLGNQRGWYTPESRLGQYFIRYKVKGEEQAHFVGIEDQATLRARLDALDKDPTTVVGSVKAYSRYQHDRDVNTLYSDIITVFGDLEKRAFAAALDETRKVSPEAAETMERLFHPTEAVFREVMLRGFGKHFTQRKLVPGREEINMVQGIVAYLEGLSLGMSKSMTKRRSALLLADPEMKSNPDLRAMARDYVITVVDPPGREWSRVKEMGFHFYLGSNISSLVIESFQPLFSLVPELIRAGAGVAGSYKLMGNALHSLWHLNTNHPEKVDAKYRIGDALQEAERRQAIGLGVFQEVEGLDADTTVANLRRESISAEDTMLSPWDMTKKGLYWYGHFTKGLYRGRTAFNDRVAFLSAYMHGINKGMGFDEAVNFGIRLKEASMFSGGAAARPMELFSRTGKLFGAVGALYSLRHYSTSMISNFYRMMHDSIGRSAIPKTEVAAARKALSHMVATQLVLSGALGLPFASAAFSIAEQLFPNLELKKAVREGMASISGDDAEMGEVLSDLFLRGVTTAFTPFDLSARFGLGDAFGIDPNRGFSAATVFGVPGSLFERAVKGVQGAAAGDPTEAARQFLPNAFSTLIKLYHDDFKLRDRNGNLLYDPQASDVMLAAVGFRPRALAKAREEQALMSRADEIAKRKLSQFHDEAAQVLIKGRPDQVRQMLLERAEADETYSVYAGIRSIVDSALDQSYPKEFGRTGIRSAMASREEIARTFPSQPQPLTETERVLKGAELERTLGVAGVGRVSRSELRDAQIVDFLRQQSPGLSRQHALLMLERLRGGEARRTRSIAQLY